MKTVSKLFNDALGQLKENEWNTIYILVDIHDTILPSDYNNNIQKLDYYPNARDVLNLLSKKQTFKLILWTSSHDRVIEKYISLFRKDGIEFDYVNSNPEVCNSHYGCYTIKPYFSIGLDDKCGFEPEKDWLELLHYIKNNLELIR